MQTAKGPLWIPDRAKAVIGSAAVLGCACVILTLAMFIGKVDALLDARGKISAHVVCFEQRVVEYETRKDRYIEAVILGQGDGEPSVETLRKEALHAHFRVLRAANPGVKDSCPPLPD